MIEIQLSKGQRKDIIFKLMRKHNFNVKVLKALRAMTDEEIINYVISII